VVAGEIAAEHGDLQQVSGDVRRWRRGRARDASIRSRAEISAKVRTLSGAASGLARADMVTKKMHQLTTAMRARNFVSRSAVSSLASSARQPDFMTLWNTSAFQRRAYQPSFSTAAAKSPTGRLVTSFQSIGSRPGGGSSSRAWM